jgi:alkyldihydroxyacetonephosphate synthase
MSVQEPERIAYARDMWPRSLIRQRAGFIDCPPDMVVWPGTQGEVMQVVALARELALPLIPFGAGSGVCGGTLPVHGGVVVDLKRLDRILAIVPQDQIAIIEAGAVGEIVERDLNQQGWTLGHFPSSIYCSTVGGWLAARSAGQCSSRYGKIEDMVRCLTYVDASGRLCSTPFTPPGFSTWSVDPLLVGCEGTLAMILSAALTVRPLPRERSFRGYRFVDVESGLRAMRMMLRQGLRPSVLRLYDQFDTIIAKSGVDEGMVKESLLDGLSQRVAEPLKRFFGASLTQILRSPSWLNRVATLIPSGCLLIVVCEGEPEDQKFAAGQVDECCKKQQGQDLGPGPGQAWWQHRYDISYKQSPLFAGGAFVDTMEVATTWDRVWPLYLAVRQALSGLVFIMAHFSHAYREGCSIYFSIAGAAADDQESVALYDRIWETAQSTVLREGGAISHHHGVGVSKQRFLYRQRGDANILAQAVKQAFDPTSLFNPGKLGLGKDVEAP